MASHSTPRMFSFVAGADLSSAQYKFLDFGSGDTLVGLAAVAGSPIGVLQNAPASGEVAEVALQGGGAKLKLGGTVARGDFLKPNASSLGIAATAGDKYGARAMASGVSGDVIPVEVVYGELET